MDFDLNIVSFLDYVPVDNPNVKKFPSKISRCKLEHGTYLFTTVSHGGLYSRNFEIYDVMTAKSVHGYNYKTVGSIKLVYDKSDSCWWVYPRGSFNEETLERCLTVKRFALEYAEKYLRVDM